MSTPADHILVVDDDPEIRLLLKPVSGEEQATRSTAVGEGGGMWMTLERSRVDLLVLDLMLPGWTGWSSAATCARAPSAVIMLTARGDEMDRVLGLEMGADDYLAKPFSARELLARIKTVLRRVRDLPADPLADSPERLAFNGWSTGHPTQAPDLADGLVVPLSQAEFRLLQTLLIHPNGADPRPAAPT